MITDIKQLRQKIARIQRELEEISDALNEVENQPQPTLRHKTVDRKALTDQYGDLLKQLGLEKIASVDIEALQQKMLNDGINPEDCTLSRGILEMRDE